MWHLPQLTLLVNLLLPLLMLFFTLLGQLAVGYKFLWHGFQTLTYAFTILGWLLQPMDLLEQMVKTPFGRVIRDQPLLFSRFFSEKTPWHHNLQLLLLILNTVLVLVFLLYSVFCKGTPGVENSNNLIVRNSIINYPSSPTPITLTL